MTTMGSASSAVQGELASERAARRLRGVLGENRISGSAIAKEIGLTQSAFSRRLVGAAPFSLDELCAIAEVLDVDVVKLIGLDGEDGPRLEVGRQFPRSTSSGPVGGGVTFLTVGDGAGFAIPRGMSEPDAEEFDGVVLSLPRRSRFTVVDGEAMG